MIDNALGQNTNSYPADSADVSVINNSKEHED